MKLTGSVCVIEDLGSNMTKPHAIRLIGCMVARLLPHAFATWSLLSAPLNL